MMLNAVYSPPIDMPRVSVSPDTRAYVRRARVQDVPRLYNMINYYAASGDMLPKTLDNLYNRLREFKVVDAGGEVVGCAALKIIWHDLAEITSVAVHPDFQERSLGKRLIEAIFDEAYELGIPTVCTLTLQPGFFSRMGFREVPKFYMPHKVWQDCDQCFKRDRCDEVPMIREMIS